MSSRLYPIWLHVIDLGFRPNAKKGRAIYRTKASDPIYIHSSVVDYLTSSTSDATKEDYEPRAKWHGYEEDEWPRIEDIAHAEVAGFGKEPESNYVFPEEAKKKLNKIEFRRTAGMLEKWGSF